MSSTPGADIRVVFREDRRLSMLWRGGWGVRTAPQGRAYDPRGDRGVLPTLADGRTLLIGSQRPAELAAAIEREPTGATTSGRGPLRGAP